MRIGNEKATNMPVHKANGGWQWGSQKVYRGKGAKAKAARQGRAVRASGWGEDKRTSRNWIARALKNK